MYDNNAICEWEVIMGLLQAVFICLGLSLDSFVLMMDKGATMRKLELKKAMLYSLVYSLAAEILLLIGYLISFIFTGFLTSKMKLFIAIILIFTIGVYIFFKSLKIEESEERVDDSFNLKKCFKLAIFTNIDTLCLGIGFSFSKIEIIVSVLMIFVISFIVILIAQYIGYTQGAKHTRILGVSGGMLIIVFSIYLYSRIFGLI